MPELALGRDFLPAYAKLQTRVQRAVIAAIAKFAEHTHAGLHLEKLTGARDPNVRTIRIDRFYRGVVLALGEERYALLNVLPHDDAIDFALSRRFTVNQTLGVLEMRDQAGIEEFARTEPVSMHGGLFDHVPAADFVRLGIDEDLVPLLRVITTDQQLKSLAGRLPETQLGTLNDLATGMTVAEVWAELADRVVSGVDTDDLLTAARRTPERIAFVSGPVELAAILAHPFDVWRTFLHPTQRDVAYRETYSGPALVTGSAGTGKTVTGLHRAVFLAERLPDGEKVLLTTFTRALANALTRQLYRLTADPAVRARIDVISVDKLAHDIVTRHSGKVAVAEREILDHLWEAAAKAGPTYVNRAGQVTGVSAAFLRREWEQVVLAQQLTTLDEYLGTTRKGRGAGLRATQRAQVWTAIDGVARELAKRRLRTHTQLADDAAAILRRSSARYRHVVVDEGQDLHPAQWRLLRALVPPGPNDMFLLADPHQRIYDSHVSLTQLGIEVRGRTRRLTVNYRTTHEILDLSVRVLSGDTATGLDGQDDTLRGYRSITRGGAPDLVAHPSRDDEHDALVERVGTWLDQGVEEHAIGVAVRTGQLVRTISRILGEAHIPVADDKRGVDGVRVATMHQMKGLEFQCLAVVGLDAGILPAPNALTSAAEDPHAHRQDLQRERCLLFVALTRARDVLYLSHTGTPSPLLPAGR
ncbi:UvrD-helicase domain-containing protein [Micromonospora sagamiensis]|uniref:DNA 3'-5' helicase n=1 Tax=Micromonospora sagamiensis TaxID=47875 RepID=A0A562WAU5_9ACTN|nr:UvrD-helicase domain-containing protein [Micromonospora sagamiensis]TWJ27238.1 UvrD-like helicase family protein [Micromonospora sagamiensis]BCL13868.1 DNA helicase [Micromonospora sagamiensis]